MNSNIQLAKLEIIESFYKIFSTSTRKGKDENIPNNEYFKRRILGFKAELEFEKEINKNFTQYKFLEGGQFATEPIDKTQSKSSTSIYTSFDYLDPDEYLPIYKKIANWSSVGEMTYIKILKNGWRKEQIKVKEDEVKTFQEILEPRYIFYRFDKSTLKFFIDKSVSFSDLLSKFDDPLTTVSISSLRGREQFDYLNDYEIDLLKKIYATRYFMDHKKRVKAKVNFLDLDGFLINRNDEDDIKLIEVKEKSPNNKCKKATKTLPERPLTEEEWQYGWDIRRMAWFQEINKSIDVPIIYIVRQIEERYQRKFVQWDAITLDGFLESVNWSAEVTGGGSSGTLMVPYLQFQRLYKVI